MLGWDSRAARWTWTAAIVLLLLYVAYTVRGTLFILVVSLLFAYLLFPLVDLVNRYLPARSRTPALAIVYLLLVGIMATLVVEIGSQAAEQATSLSERAPELLNKLRKQPPTGPLPGAVQSVQQTVINTLEGYVYKHYNDFVSLIPRVTLQVLKASTNLIYLVIIPILSFFLLKDGRSIRDELVDVLGTGRSRELVTEIFSDIHILLLQYMRALFTLCIITLITFAGVLSALGVPYSLLLACVAFPLEFIPLIGPLVAAATIIGVTAFSDPSRLLAVVVFLGAYRLVQDYVISPRLMSSGVELHPLLVILGVFAGGELAGVAGSFLSVPVLALLRVMYRRVRQWQYMGRASAVVRAAEPAPQIR